MPNLGIIFTTGLLTGGLSCLAVQGGLLIAGGIKKEGTVVFLIFKLIAYTILGFLLGSIGSAFQLSITARAIMQFIVVIFMLGSALNLLNVHPIFRYFVIQPPKFLTRLIKDQTKSQSFFTPAILGAFTVFIPCGTTQAMMALAIGSGSPLAGAAILFAFILGTSPAFLVLSLVATTKAFAKVAAVGIILLAIYNLDGALALTGSNFTFGNIARSAYCTVSFCRENVKAASATGKEGVTDPVIYIDSYGYSPNSQVIKAGANINLKVVNRNGQGCIQAFTIPSLGVQKVVRPGSEELISFVAPAQAGEINFMCSMGMYRGKLIVE